MRFQFDIEARRKNSIGVKRRFFAEREGSDLDAATLALYDEFEHVNVIRSWAITSKGDAK